MSAAEVEILKNEFVDDPSFVLRELIAFNEGVTGPAGAGDLTVIARHDGENVGGLVGLTHWNWLHIRLFWIAEPFRRQGVGTRLLRAAEDEARLRGCEHAHLDTFSFQALPFYQKHGYTVFGQLEDYPPGHRRFFLQKMLTTS